MSWQVPSFAPCFPWFQIPHSRSLGVFNVGCYPGPLLGPINLEADESEGAGALQRYNLLRSDHVIDAGIPNAFVAMADVYHGLDYQQNVNVGQALTPCNLAGAVDGVIANPNPGQPLSCTLWQYEQVRFLGSWPTMPCSGDPQRAATRLVAGSLSATSCWQTCTCAAPPPSVVQGQWTNLGTVTFSDASLTFTWGYGVGAGAFQAPTGTTGTSIWSRVHALFALAVTDASQPGPPTLTLPTAPTICTPTILVPTVAAINTTLTVRVAAFPLDRTLLLLGLPAPTSAPTPCGPLQLDVTQPILPLADIGFAAGQTVWNGSLAIPNLPGLVGFSFATQGASIGSSCGCMTTEIATSVITL